ncbi:MAG: hypothetical protein NWF05_00460 [Candidatus Bathyarchaeota archaeon]|nr:hypothetical protein [Candidatus Bathyarchaeota archaeon]
MSKLSSPQRLKIALGGFVSFIGLAVLSCAILTLTGTVDLALVFQNDFALAAAFAVAALDVGCGLLLILRNREIVLSLASNQEKTRNNTD